MSDTAVLLGDPDQVRLTADAGGPRAGWRTLALALQHYVPKSNEFLSWAEGEFDIHESDFRSLVAALGNFGRGTTRALPLQFEPAVEPTFSLEFAESADESVSATISIDIKCMVAFRQPVAYREFRIALQMRTTRRAVADFAAGLVGHDPSVKY